MINYIIRRIGYGLLILIGVNVLTFILFFQVFQNKCMNYTNVKMIPILVLVYQIVYKYTKCLLKI